MTHAHTRTNAQRHGFLPFAPLLIIVFALIMLAPILIGTLSPEIKLIMQGFFAVSIFLFVRGFLGPGLLAYAISGVLIYIFAWRLWWLFSAGYMIYMVIGFGLTSFIFFALQR